MIPEQESYNGFILSLDKIDKNLFINKLENHLKKNFSTLKVEYIECPDLTSWGLANKGLCGKNTLVDIGGEAFCHNRNYKNVSFNVETLGKFYNLEKRYVLGNSCCDLKKVDHNGEVLMSIDLKNNKNLSTFGYIEDNTIKADSYNFKSIGGLGNIQYTEGLPGKVICIKAKTRRGSQISFPQMIRDVLKVSFQTAMGIREYLKLNQVK